MAKKKKAVKTKKKKVAAKKKKPVKRKPLAKKKSTPESIEPLPETAKTIFEDGYADGDEGFDKSFDDNNDGILAD
jgi:hypothetical protein